MHSRRAAGFRYPTYGLAQRGEFSSEAALDSIETIGANSVQGSGDRFVIGNWIDYDSGYMGDWHMDGGLCYNTHPDVYNILKQALPEDELDDVLAAINQAALSDAISDNIDFDYSLLDLETENLNKDITAIDAIAHGNLSEVTTILEETDIPARMTEVQMLIDAGYTYEIDLISQVIHFVKE